MLTNKLELIEKVDCLVICPTRIRPEQAIAMYHTFKNTRAKIKIEYDISLKGTGEKCGNINPSHYENISEIIFYIADDDPKLEIYKKELKNCAYIIDKRRTIIEVMNYIALELYPDKKYYSCIGDDNRYNTMDWDSEFIKEIETKGRGWGFAYGADKLQNKNLIGNPIISGNVIKALGYMALPALQHQYVDNSWTDIAVSINRAYYKENIVLEHLHPFAKKGQMDDNYKWVYQSGVGEQDKAAYIEWRKTAFIKDIQRVIKAMMADYRKREDYKTIGLCVICGDFEKPEVLRRLLLSTANYLDSINIIFNYKHFPNKRRLKKFIEALKEFQNVNYKYLPWTNFSDMKNESLEINQSNYSWVMDTDDFLEIPNGILIHDCIHFRQDVDCFKCRVLSDTPNGGQELILQNRLFKNK